MSLPTWLSQALYNRWRGSYFSGDVDTEGNVVIRGTSSLWLDTTTSIKLNGGTVVTLSRDELSYLDGVTSSIQTQINGKATTGDVTTLQTKTQNITSATSTLTTIEDNVTLSTGNLVLTAGDLTVAGTKSFFMNGELNLGSTGRISGTGLTISNAQLIYLNGLTANIESRLASVVTKTQLLTSTASLATFSNAVTLTTGNLTLSNGDLSVISGKSILNNGILNFGTTGNITVNGANISNTQIGYLTGLTASVETRIANNTTAINTNTTNIGTNTSNIGTLQTDVGTLQTDVGTLQNDVSNLQDKTTGIGYSSGDTTIGGTLYIFKSIVLPPPSPPLLIPVSVNSLFDSIDSLTGQVDNLNFNTSGITYDDTTDVTTINNGLVITGNITANSQTITPTNLGHISGLTSNAQTQLTALQTKTANQTAVGTATTYTGSHAFNGSISVSTTRTLQINGTGRILLNGTTSYFELGTSLGIFCGGTIYINATELSMLNGATYNLPTAVTNNSNDISTLLNRTTNISYDLPTVTTTISGIVNFTGTTKTTGQAWLDGAVKLKTTYVAPVSGELGFTVLSSLTTVSSITTNVVKNLLQVSLGIGVWIITYNCFIVYGTPIVTTFLKVGLNTTSGSTQATTGITTESSGSYVASKNYPMTQIVNVSSATTYYLTLYALFSGGSMSVDGGNVNTTTLHAIRIA